MSSAGEGKARIAECAPDPFRRFEYRLAETAEQRDEIYRLRYRAYLREGAVSPSESGRVTDEYDDAPNSWTFGVFRHGELYSSVRISVLTSDCRMSFSAELFGDILHPRLDRGEIIVDPARFVADPEKAGRFPELPYVTLRLAYAACEHFDADLGLAIVRPEHQAFYRRVFMHETIAEPRLLRGLLKPVGLMAADFPAFREKVFERFPYMRSSEVERRMLFRRGDTSLSASPEGVSVFQRAAASRDAESRDAESRDAESRDPDDPAPRLVPAGG